MEAVSEFEKVAVTYRRLSKSRRHYAVFKSNSPFTGWY